MLSVLWIWTPSLLARACNSAVFPATEQSVSWMKVWGHLKRQEEKQSALPTRWSNTQRQPFSFQQASAVPVKVHSGEDRVTGRRCKAGGGPRGHVCHSTVSFRARGHHRAMEAQPRPMLSWLQTLPCLTQPARKEKTEHQGGAAACTQLPNQFLTRQHLQQQEGRTQSRCPPLAHPSRDPPDRAHGPCLSAALTSAPS